MIIGSLQTTLGDLVESGEGFIQTGPFGSQLHAHDYVENGIPVVMPQQLGDNEISEYGIAQINEQDRDRLIRHVMRVGDIVFSRRGDVTRRAYITGKEDGWLCGTGCLLLRLNHPQCDNRYLVRFLGLHETRSYLTQHAIGATMPNLNQRILASVPVVLPPRDHQERIIGVISAYDDLIENNRRRIRLLEQAARLIYKEWFVHLRFPGHEHVKIKDGVPKGWDMKTLGDLVEVTKGRNITKNSAKDGSVPVVAGGLSPAYYHDTANAVGPVITISASGANAGYVNLYYEDIWASDCSYISSTSTDRLYYLYSLLKSKQREIFGFQKGAAQPHVYPKDLKRLPLLVPKDIIVSMFEESVADNFRQVKVLVEQNKLLVQARDLLLPRLMSGNISSSP